MLSNSINKSGSLDDRRSLEFLLAILLKVPVETFVFKEINTDLLNH